MQIHKNKFLSGRFFVLTLIAFFVFLGTQPGLVRASIGFSVIPPTSLVATAGNAQATVSFTPSVGGGITGYTVTSSPGNITATGSTSPITVTGLTNGTSYTFTATATNSSGQVSPASTASNAVTPEAPTVTPEAPVTPAVGSILPGYTEHNPLPWETAVSNTIPSTGNVATSSSTSTTTTFSGAITNTKYVFNKNLELGISGRDVKELQMFLNAHGFILAHSGPGSPGQETAYFGLLTKAALIAFQNAHKTTILSPLGLSIGTGYFGSSTRAFVNATP